MILWGKDYSKIFKESDPLIMTLENKVKGF